MEAPNFYAVIPATVRYDPELSSTAKLLYGEITALATKEGYCYASNQYFAELYGSTDRTIRATIAQLAQRGYLKVVTEENQRHIYVQKECFEISGGRKKTSGGEEKNFRGGAEENFRHNNTVINNTFNEYIDTYTRDEQLKESLYDFVQARKEMKKPLSELAFDRLLKKLTTLADTDEERRLIVEESIERGWQGFFPLKDKPVQQPARTQAPARQPAPRKPNFFNDYEHQSSYDWDKIQAEMEANPVLKFAKT